MPSAIPVVKRVNASEERPGRSLRRLAYAGQPGKNVLIRNVEQRFKGAELIGSHFVKLSVGEAAEKQVDLAHAAMPRAKAQPPAADSQIVVDGVAHCRSAQ
jgi:hypothetical protein